jgi:hypothetical protein
MKRIAAIAALMMITTLALPTAAMASTTTKPRPAALEISCVLSGQHHKPVTIVMVTRTRLKAIRLRPGSKVATIEVYCSGPRRKPVPVGCLPRVLRFDVAAGSSTLTEVSGPTLTPPEQFTYHGSTYTIMSINPGADSFKVFVNNALFVNNGPAITNGIAFMSCSG